MGNQPTADFTAQSTGSSSRRAPSARRAATLLVTAHTAPSSYSSTCARPRPSVCTSGSPPAGHHTSENGGGGPRGGGAGPAASARPSAGSSARGPGRSGPHAASTRDTPTG